MKKFSVILAAAGKSSRFRDKHYKKPFVPLAGRAVWLHAAERFLNREDCRQLILVLAAEDRESFQTKFGANVAILGVDVVEGGLQRADSIERGLAHLKPDIDFVAVHDAARPCIAEEWISQVFTAATETGAAILAIPVTGALKRVENGTQVKGTVPRQQMWEAQTPQVFRREVLLEAYAKRAGYAAVDDAELVERLGYRVTIVRGSPVNLKITTKEDQRLAEQAFRAMPKPKLSSPTHPFAGDDLWR